MKIPETTPEMFPGLLGELVNATAVCTEAHPAGIAGQFLVAFGAAAGRELCTYVAETRHGVNEDLLIVGRTGTGRKGDAWNMARAVIEPADPDWAKTGIRSGLSSGEGLIYHVRDPQYAPDKKTGEPVLVDAGVADKRLLVVESEFSQPLKMFRREGNVLSNTLRDAFDGKPVLSTLTKHTPLQATAAHVSVIGHTTPEDLRKHLSDLDVADGFANRFLFAAVERQRLIPSPPRIPSAVRQRLIEHTQRALDTARTRGELRRTEAAEDLWCTVYPTLTAVRPGLAGALLARGTAHVTRLSALFALLALAPLIDAEHLTAALSWWDYSVASVETIFADRTGNAEADRIKAEMLSGETMTLKEIRERIFANHVATSRLRDGLDLLRNLGVVRLDSQLTGGRPRLLVTRLAENGAPA
jgi:hypothetical protein